MHSEQCDLFSTTLACQFVPTWINETKVISETMSNWKQIGTLLTETVIYFLWDLKSTLNVTDTEFDFDHFR